MTRRRTTKATGRGRERRISVRAIRRTEPDYKKLGQALLAIAQAEADAAAMKRGATDVGGSKSGEDTEVDHDG